MKKRWIIVILILAIHWVLVVGGVSGAATPTATWKTWYTTAGTARTTLFLKDAKAIKKAEKSSDSSKTNVDCKKLRKDSNPFGKLNKHQYFPGNTILDSEWIGMVSEFNVASIACVYGDVGHESGELKQAIKNVAHLNNQMEG